MNYLVYSMLLINTLSYQVYATDKDALYELIFTDKDSDLAPERTLEVLQEYNYIDPSDKDVEYLLNLSKNHEEKCDHETVQKFRLEKWADYFSFSRKMIPTKIKVYKEYQWEKWALACRESWKKNLEQELATLSEEDKEQVTAMKDSVFDNVQWREYKKLEEQLGKPRPGRYNYKGKFFGVSTRKIADSMLPYFEKNIAHDLTLILAHKSLFNQKYETLIKDVCFKVGSRMKLSHILYKLVIYESENYVDDDETVLNWLENLEVCEMVNISRNLDLSKHLRRALKLKYPGFGRKIFKKLEKLVR